MPSYLLTQFMSGVRCANGCRCSNKSACHGALRLREEQSMAAAIPPARARPSSGPAAVRFGASGSLSNTSSAANNNVAGPIKGGLAIAAGAAILRMPDNAPSSAAWAYTCEFATFRRLIPCAFVTEEVCFLPVFFASGSHSDIKVEASFAVHFEIGLIGPLNCTGVLGLPDLPPQTHHRLR